MSILQQWYLDKDIAFYKPAYKHPNWHTAQPTADWDIFWFKVMPCDEWKKFGFDYFESKIFLRYCRQVENLTIEIHISAELNPENLESMDGLFSIYFVDNVEQLNQQPFKTTRYSIFSNFNDKISLCWKSELLYIGFYASILYPE